MPVSGQGIQGALIIQENTSLDEIVSSEIDFTDASDTTQSWFLVQASPSPVIDSILAVWNTSMLTANPLVTFTTVATSAAPIPATLPANPAEISPAPARLPIGKGVGVTLGIFVMLGAYLAIRMFINI